MNDSRSRPAVEPFAGLPDLPALMELRRLDQWVAWDLRWKAERAAWIKLPIDPRTGRAASTNDPATWSSYGAAAYRAAKEGLSGVGFVLTADDGLTGIDLDKVREPVSGSLLPWAAELTAAAETYGEVSPSGTGIRMFARGKIEASVASKPASVELYRDGRYLTVTGRHLLGTTDEIRTAPRTLEALLSRIGDHAPAEPPAKVRSAMCGDGDTFWRRVNSTALDRLDGWVRDLFPRARRKPQGYRVTSRDLGRNLEEDLLIYSRGIMDCGVWDIGDAREGRRTPIDLVVEQHGVPADEAARWLCARMGIEPEALGWGAAPARTITAPTYPDRTMPASRAREVVAAAMQSHFEAARRWRARDG